MEKRFLEVKEARRLLAPGFEGMVYTNEEVVELFGIHDTLSLHGSWLQLRKTGMERCVMEVVFCKIEEEVWVPIWD